MKRILALVMLFVLAAAGCSAGGKGYAARLNRQTVLPDELVCELAGVPMRMAYDRIEEENGYACWAWEETDGLPKLLVMEFRYPPADCDALYDAAQAASEPIKAPAGVTACYDGRAAHVRAGAFYVRISALGMPDEMEALGQAIAALSGNINDTQ